MTDTEFANFLEHYQKWNISEWKKKISNVSPHNNCKYFIILIKSQFHTLLMYGLDLRLDEVYKSCDKASG